MASVQTRCTAVRRAPQPTASLPSSSPSSLLGTHHVQAGLICAAPADSKSSDADIFPPAPTPPCHKVTYSLSSQPPIPPLSSSSRSTRSRSRSRPISSPSCSSSFRSSPVSTQFSSLWDEDSDSDLQFSPIKPLDHFKTLLSQLAASISALKTTHAHQQAAFNPFNMQRAVCEEASAAADISAMDKIMAEGLERLSYLHVQLSRVPHLQLFATAEPDKGKNETEGFAAEILPDAEEKKKDFIMLKRYEEIITRFHEEIERKEAVTAALKETLARSMLQGEKLERRVKSLEAALSHVAQV